MSFFERIVKRMFGDLGIDSDVDIDDMKAHVKDAKAATTGNWLLDGLVNWWNATTGAGMTARDKESIDYQNQWQEDIYNKYGSPEKQLVSQAAGFDAIGLNRMMLGGSAPGASAQTSASPGGSSVGSASDVGSFVTGILGAAIQADKVDKDYRARMAEVGVHQQDVDSKVALNEVLKGLYGSETNRNTIYNQNLPELLGLQKDQIKSSLNNDLVQRNLWRSGITVNEAKAALDRSTAWLNAIESRIKTSDANTRDRFNYLTNQLYYWSVESAKVQGSYASKFAQKQLSLISQQIALLGEQKYGVMVNYLKGYEDWQQAKFVTGHQNITYWNDLISSDIKVLGQTLGVAFGLGKFFSPSPAPQFPVLQSPSPTPVPNDPTLRWPGLVTP